MKLYEACRQAKTAHPMPERSSSGSGLWMVRHPSNRGVLRNSFHSGDEALNYRKASIAEHAARLMGVTDPDQLALAWTLEAKRGEDLFRLVMKGGSNVQ